MSSPGEKGKPLPKFGEWDVNDPASAEGFTVIFSKARDEKKTGTPSNMGSQRKQPNTPKENSKKKWLCFK